jgi:hypothetical protein
MPPPPACSCLAPASAGPAVSAILLAVAAGVLAIFFVAAVLLARSALRRSVPDDETRDRAPAGRRPVDPWREAGRRMRPPR